MIQVNYTLRCPIFQEKAKRGQAPFFKEGGQSQFINQKDLKGQSPKKGPVPFLLLRFDNLGSL
jgi:hypothetical protein